MDSERASVPDLEQPVQGSVEEVQVVAAVTPPSRIGGRHIMPLTHAAVGSIVALLLTVVSGKIIAVIAGPIGIGLLSLLRQLRQASYSLSTVSGQTALIQGASRLGARARARYLATVFVVFAIATTVVAFGLVLFAPQIASAVLGSSTVQSRRLVRWLALPVFCGSFQFFTSGMLMTQRAMGRLAIVQMLSGAALLGISYPAALAFRNGVEMALLWVLVAYSGTGLAVSSFLAWRTGWVSDFLGALPLGKRDAVHARHFFSIAGTMVFTAFVGTGGLLVVRTVVATSGTLRAAGVFDAAYTLAVGIPLAVTAAMQGYYLPLLSNRQTASVRAREVQRFFAMVVVFALPVVVAGMTLRPFAIRLFYSNDFAAASSVLGFMLVGLYFRITTWVLTVPMLANGDMRAWARLELGWNAVFLSGALYFRWNSSSMEVIGIGYAAAWFLGALYGFSYLWAKGEWAISGRDVVHWAVGLVVLGTSLAITWGVGKVKWESVLVWVGLAIIVGGWHSVTARRA